MTKHTNAESLVGLEGRDAGCPNESLSVIVLDCDAAVAEFRSSLLRFEPKPTEVLIQVGSDYAGPDAESVASRLNALYSDCGCGAGTIAMFITLIAWLLIIGVPTDLTGALQALGVLVVGAVVGKGVGLARNRLLMVRLMKRFMELAARADEGARA